MVNHLICRIRADITDEAAFLDLGTILASAGNLAGFNELLTYRNARGGSGTALAFEVCRRLVADGRTEAVLVLCRGFGDTNPFSAALHCGGALARFHRFEHDQGIELLREGVRRLLLLGVQLSAEALPLPCLTEILTASFLAAPLAALPATGHDLGTIAIRHPGDWRGRAALCAAFDGSARFRVRGEGFVRSFFDHAGAETALLVGIVDPDDAAEALAGDLARRYPALSVAIVGSQGWRAAEYCRAARFLFAEALLELAGLPLILTELDTDFRPGSEQMLAIMRGLPLAGILTPELLPHKRVDTALIVSQPGPAARSFFTRVTDYLRAKLDEPGPLGAYDRMAVYRAIAALRLDGTAFANLAEVLPELPGRLPPSMPRSPAILTTTESQPVAILFKGDSNFDSLSTMVDHWAAALRTQGLSPEIIDLRAPDAEAARMRRLLQSGRIELFLSVNVYGAPVRGQGPMLFEHSAAPLFLYFVDHPVYVSTFVQAEVPNLVASFPTPSNLSFCHSHIRSDVPLLHLPHAAAPGPAMPWAERDIPVLLVGSLHKDPEEMRAGWAKYGPAVRSRLEAILALHRVAPHRPLQEVVQEVVADPALPVEMLRSYFSQADTYLRSLVRREFLHAASSLPVTLVGRGWEGRLPTSSQVRLLGEHSAVEVFGMMARSKIVLNLLPPYYESHERPFQAMAHGGVAATPAAPWLMSAVGAHALLALPPDPVEAASRICTALADDNDLAARATAGTAAFLAGHTWEHRASHLLGWLKFIGRSRKQVEVF